MKFAMLLAALAAGTAATEPPQQFDLICTGKTEQTTINGKSQEPFSATYHLDLQAKKWCEDGCGAIYDIYSVQPATIQLKEPKHEEHRWGDEIDESFIGRTDGTYSALFSTGQGMNILMRKTDGHCEPAPFTGFPKIQTKF